MIYTSLHTLVQELNEFIKLKFPTDSERAILGSLLNESGIPRDENQNKIILTLVNVDQEVFLQHALPSHDIGQEPFARNSPDIFKMDVLVTAIFSDYKEALKYLSTAIHFFQAKPIFTSENSSRRDPSLQKITIEQVNLSYSDRQNLWATLGTTYQPSVLYKVRFLSLNNDEIHPLIPVVSVVK